MSGVLVCDECRHVLSAHRDQGQGFRCTVNNLKGRCDCVWVEGGAVFAIGSRQWSEMPDARKRAMGARHD